MTERFFDEADALYWQAVRDKQLLDKLLSESKFFVNKIGVAGEFYMGGRLVAPDKCTLYDVQTDDSGVSFNRASLIGLGLGRFMADSDEDLGNLGNTIESIFGQFVYHDYEKVEDVLAKQSKRILRIGTETLMKTPALNQLLQTSFIEHIEPEPDQRFFAKPGVGFGYYVIMKHIHNKVPTPESH